MADPAPPQPRAPAPRWFVWLGFCALGAYAVLLGVNATVAAGGSDSSGYLNSARMLASGRLETQVRVPPGFGATEPVSWPHFQPLGLCAFEANPRLIPTYPSGLPLHLALAGKILGWLWGPLFVELAGALAAVWLCYAVGREIGIEWMPSAAGAVVLAACPIMLFASLQPLSDTLATTWCLAAVWAALCARNRGSERPPLRRMGWVILCGAAYGVAVLVRPTNIVLAPALLVLLGFQWRRLAAAVLGGLPAVAWLAIYNQSLYGGAFRSGYLNWSEFFALSYITPTAQQFMRSLVVFVPAVLLVLPFAAFARRETRTRELLALAFWCAAITGLYLFCAFAHEAWTCLRYILPALPALILMGLLGIEALTRSLAASTARRVRHAAALVLAVWAVGVSWYWSPRHAVFHVKQFEDAYITASAALRAYFPPNTLVLCCHPSGAVFFYTDFPILRWDGITPAEFARYVAQAQREGVILAALLFAGEEQSALREQCPGDWTRLATVDNIGLWRLNPPPSENLQ